MANETVLQWAGATNVGAVRSNNEDRYIARDEAGLWVVADGMGGHRGGEIASQIACEQIAQHYDLQTTQGLISAIEAANSAVFQVGADDPDLAGMGTTVVALAVVDQEDQEMLAVANVGDSRAYRLTGGELEQLTEDHSLVADMVREGSLSPEEAASHPQRNILTRVLGVYEDVPIDVITVTPHHGDRFLLCSDGLFNEVTEEHIASVLRRLADPAEVVDELVREAVEAGGRDNVTVVLVDVVADGRGGGNAAAHAAAAPVTAPEPGSTTGGDTARHDALAPYSGGAYVDEPAPDTSPSGRLTSRWRQLRDTRPARDVDGSDDGDDRDDEAPRHRSTSPSRPRRLTWRVALFTLILLAVLGGAFATIQWYGRSAYFVGFSGRDVAIFRGRPGGVLWIDPERVELTPLSRSDVPAANVADIRAGKEEPSLAEARAYVDRLVDEVEEQQANRPTTTTSTTAATLPTTTTAAPPATPPAWSGRPQSTPE